MDILTHWLAATPATHPFPGLEAAFFQMNPASLAACAFLVILALGFAGGCLARGRALSAVETADEEFEHAYRTSAHALAVYQDQLRFPGSPSYAIYEAASKELSFHLLGTDTVDGTFATRLLSAGRISPSQMEVAHRAVERRVKDAGQAFEHGLRGQGVKALPFVGLLGTWVGWLENSAGPASKAAQAGTLIPMAVSVLLFLLLMLWHNAIVRRARHDLDEVEGFAADLCGIFDRTYVDHRKPMESLPSLGMMGMNDAPNLSLPPSDKAVPRPAHSATIA